MRIHQLAAVTFLLMVVSSNAADPVPPVFANPDVRSAVEMIFSAAGESNRIHVYEVSSDLLNWSLLEKFHTDSGMSTYRKLWYRTNLSEFYRTVELPPFSVTNITYRKWTDAVVLGNGRVEVIVVPSIGRVLQFRRTGETEGPFWINPTTEGLPPSTEEYLNFGGDKIWPAPQSIWTWPPPIGFDSVSYTLSNDKVTLQLFGPIESESGFSVARTIAVDHFEPTMTITTTFRRERAPTISEYDELSVWTVTQLNTPLSTYVPASTSPAFPGGYNTIGAFNAPPPSLISVDNGLVGLQRNPLASHRIGNDQDRLLWVGSQEVLLMHSTRTEGTYPNGGASAEITTNGGADAYVELALLTRLANLSVGQSLDQVVTYTLLPRTEPTPEAEALKLFDF